LAWIAKEILIIEYGDIQCPFCKRQVTQKTIETVVANNPWTVSATFQHFPLSFHPNAQPAAEATECLKQETTENIAIFYDYLYQLFTTNDLSRTALIDTAVDFWADRTSMEECLDTNETAHIVTQQMTRWQTLFGARGTPANVILNTTNGQWILVSWAQQPAAFQAAINNLLTE
jgi:protein-disulfide isomerase